MLADNHQIKSNKLTLVSLEVHGSKISFYRNIFLSQYRNIVRQNVSCELGLKQKLFKAMPTTKMADIMENNESIFRSNERMHNKIH